MMVACSWLITTQQVFVNGTAVMKTIKIFLVLLIALSLLSCNSRISQEKLGRLVFNHLKNNNHDGYLKLSLRAEDLGHIIDSLKKSETFTRYDETKKQRVINISNNLEAVVLKQRSKLKDNFHSIYKRGLQKGIVWAKAKFINIRVGMEQSIYNLAKHKSQHIYIVFKYKKKKYTLRLSHAAETKRGWIIFDYIFWDKYETK